MATPEDLDKLIEFVQQQMPTRPERIEGEHLFASERLVVSPAAGIFSRALDVGDGATIEVGTVLGTSASTRSARPSPACCRATSPSTPNG